MTVEPSAFTSSRFHSLATEGVGDGMDVERGVDEGPLVEGGVAVGEGAVVGDTVDAGDSTVVGVASGSATPHATANAKIKTSRLRIKGVSDRPYRTGP